MIGTKKKIEEKNDDDINGCNTAIRQDRTMAGTVSELRTRDTDHDGNDTNGCHSRLVQHDVVTVVPLNAAQVLLSTPLKTNRHIKKTTSTQNKTANN